MSDKPMSFDYSDPNVRIGALEALLEEAIDLLTFISSGDDVHDFLQRAEQYIHTGPKPE
jgi:hypothetical protein